MKQNQLLTIVLQSIKELGQMVLPKLDANTAQDADFTLTRMQRVVEEEIAWQLYDTGEVDDGEEQSA